MMRLKGDCNTGTTYSKRKGWLKGFRMWLLESDIANLLSIPQLEADGFTKPSVIGSSQHLRVNKSCLRKTQVSARDYLLLRWILRKPWYF